MASERERGRERERDGERERERERERQTERERVILVLLLAGPNTHAMCVYSLDKMIHSPSLSMISTVV